MYNPAFIFYATKLKIYDERGLIRIFTAPRQNSATNIMNEIEFLGLKVFFLAKN